MPEPDHALLFPRVLNRLGLRYAVTGSVAATLYGEPRLTHDIDIVLDLAAAQIPFLISAFPTPDFYAPPSEVIALEVSRPQRGHFNVIHMGSGFKADFYPAGAEELHAWALSAAARIPYRGEPIAVAPPEYVILRKLEFYREGGSQKHLRDIRGILAVSGETVDRASLERQLVARGLAELWTRIEGGR